jgi:hypothetical protein
MREIKSRHRELVKQFHPDTGNVDNEENIRNINSAYKMILDYITEYRFSFAEDEFYEQNPEEQLRRQFMDVPLWGKNNYRIPCRIVRLQERLLSQRFLQPLKNHSTAP